MAAHFSSAENICEGENCQSITDVTYYVKEKKKLCDDCASKKECIGKARQGRPNLYCEKHDGEEIKLYCKTHGAAVCQLCAMIDHQQPCMRQDIEGAIMDSRAQLNILKEKAKDKLKLCRVYGDHIHKCRKDTDTHLLALKDGVDSVINEAIKTDTDREKDDTANINQEINDMNRKLREEIQQINEKIRNNDKTRENRLELDRTNAEKRREPIDSIEAKPSDLNENAREKLKSRRDYGNQMHQCVKDTNPHLQALNGEVETLINEAIKTDKDREKEDTAKINQEIDDKNRKLQEEIQQINDEIRNNDKAREKRLKLNRTNAEKRRAPVDNKQHGLKTDIIQISVEQDRKISELEKSWEDNTITSSGPNNECAFVQSSGRPSTGGEVKVTFSKKRIDHKRTSFVVATNNTTKPSPLIMTKLSFNIFIRAFTLLLVSSVVAGEVTDITCTGDVSFTSSNYPSNYPNGANEKWFITAPHGSRILITFTDFNVEVDDFLYLADKVDKHNSKRYTGEEMEFPPFLTKGNELEMTFISLTSGTRRGFNVSASCYDHSRDANVARIVGGNSPEKGFLELRTQSGDWRRVCKDGFDERVTEVVCGELGYPAVKKVSYGTGDCISAGQDCSKAPICNDYTFRLEDCSRSYGNCTSGDAVKVECYEPGYKGCFDPEDLPQQNRFIFESTSQCVSSCRAITRKGLAIMNGKQCFCSIADYVNLPDIAPVADHSTCIQTTRGTRQVINSLVYDVSVGFCDVLDDVIHGLRDPNITWFGSIVRFACDDGYSLNGSGTVQCVPGRSPYYPVWNGSVPTCDMSGDSTSTLSTDSTLHTEDFSGKKNFSVIFIIALSIFGLFIIGFILCVVFLSKRSKMKSLASLSRFKFIRMLVKTDNQSENEMVPTKPENPHPLIADGRGSLLGPEHSPPVI